MMVGTSLKEYALPPEPHNILSLEGALMGAVTVLSGAVVALWRLFLANYKREEARAERCEERVTTLLERVATLEAQLHSRMEPPK